MFVGRSFLDIRPAGFSNLLVAVFLLVLVLTTYRNTLYIWLIVPLVVFWCNVHGGYLYLFIMLAPFVAINLLTSFSRKRFVSIGLKGIYHTVAAGLVAFLAMIIFNPFHLTNLTHTFIISFSEHAKMWRTVNEWHPAFSWANPVGTGFPFLVLFILSIGLTFLWLFSRLLLPKLLKAPKNELEEQKKQFTILSKVFGCSAAVFICWVVFISFSFLSLDAVSWLFCALFVGVLLLSIYKNVHFVYLAVLLVLLALWTADTRTAYTGRYIYPFVLIPAYVTVHIIASLFSKTVKIKPKNIFFVVVAAIAALLLMTVLFNPFKFELPVWHLKQFLDLHRIWSPKYECIGNVQLDYKHLFSVLYIVNIASIISWFVARPALAKGGTRRLLLEPQVTGHRPPATGHEPRVTNTYQPPKIDLALVIIAVLTVYMAIRMRRFIPIAAIAACPILAMFIDQMARTISAAQNFHRQNRLSVRPMPHNLQLFFTIAAAVAVLTFGTWWGLKFKRVYLDPWPTDPKLSSVFMRMTASDAKPFYACKFIKDNKLKGKMFNYWTEGGFIAWGQQPADDTGRTPLQLFMDGRAQAAYEPRAFSVWSNIMAGGPVAARIIQNARVRKRELTAAEYQKIGQWTNRQLKKRNVWIVLMPVTLTTETFIKSIERSHNWPLIFFNNRQKLFVDIQTPQGRELFNGISNGKTLYPDDFSRNLIRAHNMLLFGKKMSEKEQGLDFAIKAFELNPSPAPMLEIILVATRFAELMPRINRFCKTYFDDFTKNKEHWAKRDGQHQRMKAARLAAIHLRKIARSQKNTELVQFYDARIKEYSNEQRQLIEAKRW